MRGSAVIRRTYGPGKNNEKILYVLVISITLCMASGLSRAADTAPETQAANEVPLVVFNRTVFVFRSPLMGISPEKRAERATVTLRELLRSGESHTVSVKSNPAGQLIMVGDVLAFIVTKADLDPMKEESLGVAAQKNRRRFAESYRRNPGSPEF